MGKKPPSNPVPSLKKALNHKQIHLRQRARIILLTLDGKDEDAIAEEVGVSKRTVAKWRNAWAQDGLWIFPSEVFTQPMNATPATHTDETHTDDVPSTPPHADTPATAQPTTPPEPQFPPRLDTGFAAEIQLLPDDSMPTAARKLLLRNMARLVEWEPAVREGIDPEGVHKMRVATRRLRSVMEIFVRYIETDDYKSIRKPVRKTARRLGDVRDLDVFMETVHRYIETELNGDTAHLAPMLNALDKPYKRARKRLIRWLDHDKFDDFVQDFVTDLRRDDIEMVTDWHRYTVSQMVPRLIYTYLEYVRLHEPFLPDADIEMLHEVRLDAKRLRYVLEFFDDVLGPEASTVVESTKALQDYLGALNDYSVANDIARELQDDLSGKDKDAVKAFRSYCKAQVKALQDNVATAWADFDTPELRAALGAAVGRL
jgi:CHAD domain-containing protein